MASTGMPPISIAVTGTTPPFGALERVDFVIKQNRVQNTIVVPLNYGQCEMPALVTLDQRWYQGC
eukprot:1438716-Lingulodinium_polyedra.AAC.1